MRHAEPQPLVELTSRGFISDKVLVVAQQARRSPGVFVGLQVLWQRNLSPHLGALSHLQQHRQQQIYRGRSLSAERLHPKRHTWTQTGWRENKTKTGKRDIVMCLLFAIYYLWEASSGDGMQIKVHASSRRITLAHWDKVPRTGSSDPNLGQTVTS